MKKELTYCLPVPRVANISCPSILVACFDSTVLEAAADMKASVLSWLRCLITEYFNAKKHLLGLQLYNLF